MANDTPDRLTGQLMHLPDIIGNLGLNIAAAQTRLDENYLNNLGRLIGMIKSTIGSSATAVTASAIAAARTALERAQQLETAADNALADLPADAPATKKEAAEQKLAKAQETRSEGALKLEALLANPASAMGALLTALAPSRYQFTQSTVEFSADLAETRDTAFNVGVGVGLQAVTINAAYSTSFGYDYRAAARITSVINAIASDPALTLSLLNNATAIQSDKLKLPARSKVEDKVLARTKEIYDSLGGGAEPETT